MWLKVFIKKRKKDLVKHCGTLSQSGDLISLYVLEGQYGLSRTGGPELCDVISWLSRDQSGETANPTSVRSFNSSHSISPSLLSPSHHTTLLLLLLFLLLVLLWACSPLFYLLFKRSPCAVTERSPPTRLFVCSLSPLRLILVQKGV